MHVAALCCVAAGTGITVFTSVLALVTRGGFFVRLHLLTPVTSLAAPLIGGGLVLENGIGFAAAQIALIVLALAVANPALQAATARLGAVEAGRATPEPAE
jgi:Na+/H+ antiporter subunit